MVVTEYGVADLRGQSDEQVIQRLIAIADSRFQGELVEKARSAGKIAPDWDIPEAYRDNLPERISAAMPKETFASFPFGTDFTQIEQRLLPVMQYLADHATRPAQLAALIARGLRSGQPDEAELAALERMGLDAPHGVREHSYRALILGALRSAGQ